MALTATRLTPQKETRTFRRFLVTEDEVIFQGGLVMVSTTTDLLLNGATATGAVGAGMAMESVDATDDATLYCTVSMLPARWNNSGATIAKGNIGALCYIVDDEAVALTDGGGTRSPAGTIVDVDDDGVWVVPYGA